MRPLCYSINVTLDGCGAHTAIAAHEEMHRYSVEILTRADVLLFGRTTYELMESAWRDPSPDMPEWTLPFAKTIGAAKKYVVSSTRTSLGWNSELLQGELGEAVRALKAQPGKGVYVGGITLPRALAALGLIDEYEFIVHPCIAGTGPTVFAGLPKSVDLKLVGRKEFSSGAVALRYAVK